MKCYEGRAFGADSEPARFDDVTHPLGSPDLSSSWEVTTCVFQLICPLALQVYSCGTLTSGAETRRWIL